MPAALKEEWHVAIKRADSDAAFHEAVELAGFGESEARRVFKYKRARRKSALTAWPAEEARRRFLERFQSVMPTD